MTRKRFVKLLMADGYSRNQANSIAKKTAADGGTYGSQYWYLQFGNFHDVAFPDLKAAVEEVKDMLMEIIPAVCNAIVELFPLAVQQASQRIAALQEELKATMPDKCVCCGEIIPEGRQVCPQCEMQIDSIVKE